MVALAVLAACGEQAASDLTIERLPDVNPSLPSVPTLPPPPHEVQYSDGCFSVYGVRRRGGTTMDTDVCVTGYIVGIYVPPECPEGRTCDPPAAPHLWVADTRDAGEDDDRLMLAGYAGEPDADRRGGGAREPRALRAAGRRADRGRHPTDPGRLRGGREDQDAGPLRADERDGLQREQRPARLPQPRDPRAAARHGAGRAAVASSGPPGPRARSLRSSPRCRSDDHPPAG
ncbi:MAG: hypothetical protein M5U28_07165 [Sandaracinaceae bacterium]|nr:hypothetical protein [Sandaracinaceae bacterium]